MTKKNLRRYRNEILVGKFPAFFFSCNFIHKKDGTNRRRNASDHKLVCDVA